MKAEYKRDLQNNYLILEAAQDENESEYDLRMAEQNRIRGLLPMHSTGKDGKLYFYYEITSRQPLQSLYEKKKMKSRDMLLLFTSLNRILEEMHRYLLSPQRLVFDPEMIYMEPDREGIQLCYFPGGDYPVILLAEFLLKKLDHEDSRAVRLGYWFYQQAGGDNFSLTDTLQEILAEAQEEKYKKQEENEKTENAGQDEYIREKESGEWLQYGSADTEAAPKGKRVREDARRKAERTNNEEYAARESYEAKTAGQKPQANRRKKAETSSKEEAYHVVHHERKENLTENVVSDKKRKHFLEKFFAVVHPAVLLSVLALTVVLEVLYALSVLGITEAGGCFFLLLSGGMLANRFLINRKKKKNTWRDEEEDIGEEYEELLKDMYASPKEKEQEMIRETCCLIPQPGDGGMRLVYQSGNESRQNPQMIEIGRKPSYIGKIKGESDVVLDCDTVSRTHAKLEQKGDNCIVQDLNSRNGTFLNGRRLMPQEECILRAGDFLVFAEVEYRVIRKGAWRNEAESAAAYSTI